MGENPTTESFRHTESDHSGREITCVNKISKNNESYTYSENEYEKENVVGKVWKWRYWTNQNHYFNYTITINRDTVINGVRAVIKEAKYEDEFFSVLDYILIIHEEDGFISRFDEKTGAFTSGKYHDFQPGDKMLDFTIKGVYEFPIQNINRKVAMAGTLYPIYHIDKIGYTRAYAPGGPLDTFHQLVECTLDGKCLYNLEDEEALNKAFWDSGVHDIEAEEESPAEYFTLQGVRISHPQKGQIYLKRQGTNISKIIF